MRPSPSKPTSTSWIWSREWHEHIRCSRRSSIHCTGRPSAARQERDQQVFGIDVPLEAEAAADVEREAAHAGFRKLQD